MKNLKRLCAAWGLTLALAVLAFAGDPTPPCSPEPGITSTPPCAAAQMLPDDSLASGERPLPATTDAGEALSVTRATLDLLRGVLLIF